MKQILVLVAVALIALGFVLVAVSYGYDVPSKLNPVPPNEPQPKQPKNETKSGTQGGTNPDWYSDWYKWFIGSPNPEKKTGPHAGYPTPGQGSPSTPSTPPGGGGGGENQPLSVTVGGYTLGSDTGILGVIMLVAGVVVWLWSSKMR
jgi:hypothetical protein